jgi:signal transduction histidine kinase
MIRRVLVHWVSFLVLSFLVVSALTWMLDPFNSWESVLTKVLTSNGGNLILALILVPIFAMDTISLTHRFVGPMVQVRRELKKLSKGLPARRVKFRPNDFWHDIADDFNVMCDTAEPILAQSSGELKKQRILETIPR